MQDNITGKTILLLCEDFFGFDKELKNNLIKLGAKEVVLKNPLPIKTSFRNHMSLTKPIRHLLNPNEGVHKTKQLISEIDGYNFDVFLSVETLHFNKFFFDYLRSKNPNIKMFFFFWDTIVTHFPRYFDYFPKFDKVYTFDRDDAKRYGLEYYPDFYIEKADKQDTIIYDVSFVGKMINTNISRGRMIEYINNFCKEHGLKSYLYLKHTDYVRRDRPPRLIQMYRKFKFRKYIKEVNRMTKLNLIHPEGIPLEKFDQVFNQSRAIVDLAYTNRQGMTINCITALAKGKKLITANKRIVDEPFYDPANIFVIDEDNPQLDLDFFKTPTRPVDMSYLRMDNWLRHIINQESVEELMNVKGGVN